MFEPMIETGSGGTTGGSPGEANSGGATPTRRRATLYWDEIRARAYLKWEAAGNPPGDCTRFWLEAERELLEGR